MIISKDNKTLYTCSKDCSIRIWNTDTGEEIGRFLGHTDAIIHMILNENQKSLYTCSLDGTIKEWKL